MSCYRACRCCTRWWCWLSASHFQGGYTSIGYVCRAVQLCIVDLCDSVEVTRADGQVGRDRADERHEHNHNSLKLGGCKEHGPSKEKVRGLHGPRTQKSRAGREHGAARIV
jgi:hypothetical protein